MEQDIVYLDRNEHNYGPPKCVYDILKNADLTKISWYSRSFMTGSKSKLVAYFSERFGLPEKNILLGYGGEDILKQVVHCYISFDKTQKTLLVPRYSWWYYKAIADEVDGKTVTFPIYQDKDTFRFDIEGMRKVFQEEKPDMILIASPNNPTGNSLSLDELKKVIEVVDQDTVIVLDEAYAQYENADISYIKPLIEDTPNLLLVRSFSKYYGLAGLRIGYGFMGNGLEKFAQFSARYLGYNRLSEEIAIAAMEETAYYEDINRKMREDKALFAKELGAIDGFTVFKSDANFILVEIPQEITDGLKKFMNDKRLIIKFMNEDGFTHHLRISLGTQEQNRRVIDAIKEYASR
ncbi:MAG: histidinol-phosphate aminotransferase family protein [Proteobacteria bacterium]|nr:histidinol-phosphate aminotransferase family protein [Pseudomonadota bacterium]